MNQNFEHQEIQKLKPFILNSQEFLATNPVFAYYFKSYAAKKLYETFQKEKQEGKNVNELQSALNSWLNELDQLKVKANIATNQKQHQEEMKSYAMNLFQTADNEERNGLANKQTMQNFQLASRFFEALAFFGDLSQDLDEKKKYAKVKCVQIMKMIKDPALYQQYQERISNEQNKLLNIQINQFDNQQHIASPDQMQSNQPMAGSVFQVKQKASTIYDNDSIERIISYVSNSKINFNQSVQQIPSPISNIPNFDQKPIINQSIQEKSQIVQQSQPPQFQSPQFQYPQYPQQSQQQPESQYPKYPQYPQFQQSQQFQQQPFTPQQPQSQFQPPQSQFQQPQQQQFPQQSQFKQPDTFPQQSQFKQPEQPTFIPNSQLPQQNKQSTVINNQQYPKQSNIQQSKMNPSDEKQAITMCENAISELDFKKHDEAKSYLTSALRILANY